MNLQSRTLIICKTWISRESIISELIDKGYKVVGEIDSYNIAPNIDANPCTMELQTATVGTFLLKKKDIKTEIV